MRRYLRAWATQGPTQAGRYLVPSQRATSDKGTPHLSSGTVTSYRLYRWQGPNELTLLVSMNLTFTNDPLAWTRGSNDRFVTARRSGEHGRYRLEFATGPREVLDGSGMMSACCRTRWGSGRQSLSPEPFSSSSPDARSLAPTPTRAAKQAASSGVGPLASPLSSRVAEL